MFPQEMSVGMQRRVSTLILASGSGSFCAGTGGSSKWKSKADFPLGRIYVLVPPYIYSFGTELGLVACALT